MGFPTDARFALWLRLLRPTAGGGERRIGRLVLCNTECLFFTAHEANCDYGVLLLVSALPTLDARLVIFLLLVH